MKRILVIGGAGFIGSHTVDYLLAQGKEVVVLDNLSTGKLSYLNLFDPRLRFVQGDPLDNALLSKEMGTCDAVLHLAALPSVQQSIQDPVASLKNNTLGFVNVLQAIRQHYKPLRFVYASSAAVYGASEELPCSDQKPLPKEALSPYALEKLTNERYAELYRQLFNISCLGLRYFNVYGHRQEPTSPYAGVISKFIENYQKNEPCVIFGDGEQTRDFIHVKDVARANWLALQSTDCGIINIATGKQNSLKDLVKHIEKAGGRAANCIYQAMRPGDIIQSYGTIEKANEQLRFIAEIAFAEGIKDFFPELV